MKGGKIINFIGQELPEEIHDIHEIAYVDRSFPNRPPDGLYRISINTDYLIIERGQQINCNSPILPIATNDNGFFRNLNQKERGV